MVNSLIAAVDPDAGTDRAVLAARTLARRTRLPVEVIHVVPPRSTSTWGYERQIDADSGEVTTIVPGADVAAAIVELVQHRDGALLVLSTEATSLVSRFRRTVTGDILSALRQPVLVLGPHVPPQVSLSAVTLVVTVDRDHEPPPALPFVVSWQQTDRPRPPLVVDIVATGGWPAATIESDEEHERVDAVAEMLAAQGVQSVRRVLHGGDPVLALLDLAGELTDPVFVTTSDRWAGGRSHWYSTTRRLIQQAPHPVLVVPGDLHG